MVGALICDKPERHDRPTCHAGLHQGDKLGNYHENKGRYEFAAEVTNTRERISTFPEVWTQISYRTRRCITNKFPFGVIYQIRDKSILVVAIMHMKRKPLHRQNKKVEL